MVDYRKPIEAVRNDGLVLEVYFTGSIDDGDFEVEAADPEKAPADWSDGYHRADGQSLDPGDKWIVRNVAPVATPAPKYPEALVEEAFEVLRGLSKLVLVPGDVGTLMQRARAIIAELPAEVDVDREMVVEVMETKGWSRYDPNFDAAYDIAFDCFKRGRALAEAGEGR